MNKKKTIFYIITVSLLLISSLGIYYSYDIMKSEKKNQNFSNNNILYDFLENVYSLSFQLKKKVYQNISLQIRRQQIHFIKMLFYIVVKYP